LDVYHVVFAFCFLLTSLGASYQFSAVSLYKNGENCIELLADNPMELLRKNDLNSIHSFFQQLNFSDEKVYALFHLITAL